MRIAFPQPALTKRRVWSAYAVAATADLVQLILGPAGWAFADEAIDVAAMLVVSSLIGFHPLLLPTFAIELLPVTDLLPTWTGCVALVVARRRRSEPPPPTDGDVIDV